MRMLGPCVAVIGRYDIRLNAQGDRMSSSIEILTKIAVQAAREGIFVDPTDANFRIPEINRQVHKIFYLTPWSQSRGWQSDGWHHDVLPKDGVLLWSNISPTEIRLADGTIIQPEPGEILAIMNMKVEHRMPKVISDFRYFCRMGFDAPAWLKGEIDVPGNQT